MAWKLDQFFIIWRIGFHLSADLPGKGLTVQVKRMTELELRSCQQVWLIYAKSCGVQLSATHACHTLICALPRAYTNVQKKVSLRKVPAV